MGVGDAGVAQLVEHNVANVVVVGSNPITRFVVFCWHGKQPAMVFWSFSY